MMGLGRIEPNEKRTVFLICPITGSSEEVQGRIAAYVAKLEEGGLSVYWPKRDTDQSDPHGWAIFSSDSTAIMDAGEVHVWWDPKSRGSLSDVGMVFMLYRLGFHVRVVIANPEDMQPTPHKSFENILLRLQEITCRK